MWCGIQVQQASCAYTALSTFRTYQGLSSACTMGTLYWQLNDVWLAPSWTSIPFAAKSWMPLHYVAKRVYSPLALFSPANRTHVLVRPLSATWGGSSARCACAPPLLFAAPTTAVPLSSTARATLTTG